jgi:hypothetical protein
MASEAFIRESLRKAQAVLAAHAEPAGPSAEETVHTLRRILEDRRLLAALDDAEQAGVPIRRSPKIVPLAHRRYALAADPKDAEPPAGGGHRKQK